jgi:hypothetical protein
VLRLGLAAGIPQNSLSMTVSPVQYCPFSYTAHNSGYDLKGKYLDPKEVQATSECVRNAGGIKSVAISTIFDFGNTEYCIQGYDVESCDEHGDMIGMTWDTSKMSKLISLLHVHISIADIPQLAVNIPLPTIISRQR